MSGKNDFKESDFTEHLLKRRLARVSTTILEEYWCDKIDLRELKTQNEIIDKIVENYEIRKNNKEFSSSFKGFFRDYVLTGREADYLIDVDKPLEILRWVESWKDGKFVGNKFNFFSHTYLYLEKREIEIEKDEFISFPTISIFLLGVSKDESVALSEFDIISYYQTVEFEVVIRGDLRIVEIRGPHSLARDFVASAIVDSNNPLSAARSYFVGDQEDAQKVRTVGPVRQVIKIDSLVSMLDGSYEKLKGNFPGTVASTFEVDLDSMTSAEDEQDIHAKEIINTMLKEPLKAKVSFKYDDKSYPFQITKTGGLFFRKYIPESAITFLIGKIKLSSMERNGNRLPRKIPE